MSNVLFIGDLHLGHERAITFREGFATITDHDNYIRELWSAYITKNDIVHVLGDVAFNRESLDTIRTLPGRKILVRGNHDVFSANRYLVYFDDIQGIFKYKGYWLSHAPVHPDELRGRKNIHGHVHTKTIRKDGEIDKRYFNVSAENIGYIPRTIDWLVANIHNEPQTGGIPQ